MSAHRSLFTVCILLCMAVVVSGCRSDTDPSASPPSAATPNTDPTAASTPATSSIFPLLIAVKDLEQLAWGSVAVLHGRVTAVESIAEHPLAADEPPGADGIFTDYRVEVIALYRGQPATSVTVRQMGGTVGNHTVINQAAVDMAVGDEAVFFLLPDLQSDAWMFLFGGPQGYWKHIDGQAVPADDRFGPLPMHTLTAALAQYLRGDPPADMPQGVSAGSLVTLADAPLGEDLPLTAPWGALPQPTPTLVPTPVIDPAYWDVTWRAVSIDGVPLAADEVVSFSLFNGGKAACNSYGATVTLGPGSTFHAELGAQTAMACTPDALMLIETRFLSALAGATTFELAADGSELILRSSTNREVRFKR